jgi:Uma2 family endonuclease
MVVARTKFEVEYPESDGRPMGETELHLDWMFRILELLRWRYRGQRVYVISNLLLFYQEGNPTKFVVPDNFVVLDCDPSPRRRTFKVWEEGRVPDVVFEVTSRSSRTEDLGSKPQVYAQIGVKEYFLYDPTSEYLDAPLQGFRLDEGGKYSRIEPTADGSLRCESLGLVLRLVDQKLLMYDGQTGALLRTAAEAANDARQAAENARQTADDARQAAENARQAAENARQAAETALQAADARANIAESHAAQLEQELERLRADLRDKHASD